MNGRIHGEVKDPVDTLETIIRKRLSLLDGRRRYSLGLWSLPDGIPFDSVDFANWPIEYIQVAGSWDRMTIEVRRGDGGQHRQYVLGHQSRSNGYDRQIEVIRWNGRETSVLPSEVFSADEAADIFISYYATGSVPESLALRRLDL
jgi:hypothetical protein